MRFGDSMTPFASAFGGCGDLIGIALQHARSQDWEARRESGRKALIYAEGVWHIYEVRLSCSPEDGDLHLSSSFSLTLRPERETRLLDALNRANARCSSGAFYYRNDLSRVCFRSSVGTLVDPADVARAVVSGIERAVEKCDKFYPVFQTANLASCRSADSIEFHLADSFGTA